MAKKMRKSKKDVKVEIVIDGENGGLMSFLANAGGITVSCFEWAQNIQQFRWELDRVTSELEKIMRRAYGAVRDVAARSLDLRTAAFTLAIQRVGRAALARRHVRERVDL